jgi:two-component system NarL family sensor kinase
MRLNDEVSTTRLVLRYAMTGLVTLVIVAVVTAVISRRLGTQEAVDDADRMASIAAQAAVEPIIDDSIVELDPAAIDELDRAVRDQVLEGSLVRVKIWHSDGTILYSDESRLIGRRFALDDDETAVLAGERVHAHISDLSEPENQYEERATQLLEVYHLIRTPGGEPLLFEAYFLYTGVDDAGRRAWLRFAPVSLGALVLLELLQVPLAVSLARRLRSSQRQREDLLRSAIDATDRERRRIAGDLHDGVVQDLAGVAFTLSASARSPDGPTAGEARQSADQVRDSVRALRSLLVEIYPPNLYEEGLEAALGDLTAKVSARGIAATLVVEAPVDRLAMDQTQLVYRTALEGLRNVAAHAGASKVEVRVEGDEDMVTLKVIDDGQGVADSDLSERSGHMGLRALSDLAAGVGATVSLRSAPGQGTRLTLEVPVR